jgi:hypothetical protein
VHICMPEPISSKQSHVETALTSNVIWQKLFEAYQWMGQPTLPCPAWPGVVQGHAYLARLGLRVRAGQALECVLETSNTMLIRCGTSPM